MWARPPGEVISVKKQAHVKQEGAPDTRTTYIKKQLDWVCD